MTMPKVERMVYMHTQEPTIRKRWKWFGSQGTGTYGSAGMGKYYKRKYHKAMRQFEREEIREQLGETDRVRERGFTGANSTVNYRGW